MDFVSTKLIFSLIALLALLGYWVFNFIIIYHLARFGVGTQPKKFAVVFLLGSVALFFISVVFLSNLDINSLKNQFEKLDNSAFNFVYQK